MPIKIDTKPFGEIEIDESQVFEFPEGILGFETLHRYAILPARKETGFHWLQSLDEKALAFLLMKPSDIVSDYTPNVLQETLSSLNMENLNDADIWGIVTIPPGEPEKMTINLQGPLILNHKNNIGGQFISDNEKHGVRARVLELIDRGVL